MKQFILILLVLTAGIISCSAPSTAGTSTGSETQNPKIIGFVTASSGKPAVGVSVAVVPANYDPAVDTATIYHGVTDSNGKYEIETGRGEYAVVASTVEKSEQAIFFIPDSVRSGITVPDIQLDTVGSIQIDLSKISSTVQCTLSLIGTNIPPVTVSGGATVILDSLPVGTYPAIRLYRSDNIPYRTIVSNFTVQSGSVVTGNAVSLLMLVGSDSIYYNNPSDPVIQMRDYLRGAGYSVTFMPIQKVDTTALNPYSAVIVSSRVDRLPEVLSYLKRSPIPLLICKDSLYPFFEMTADSGWGRVNDYDSAQLQITEYHPITEYGRPLLQLPTNLIGVVLTGSASYGIPYSSAIDVAHCSQNPELSFIFCYDTDAQLKSMSAPSRRCGWFGQISNQTADAGLLMRGAIEWLIGK